MALLRRIWPVLLLAVLPLWPLRRAVLLGEAIGPFDQIRQMAPWNGPKPDQPWDVLQADGVLQFHVWRDLVFESWRQGRIPQWNPYELCGTPLLANSQSAALYPPHVLAGVLHVPTTVAMTVLAWLHLFWAGLGTYALCRRLGSRRLGGLAAGASFSLSAYMVLWTGLPSVITTAAWIPWMLYGVLRCWRSPEDEGRKVASGLAILAGSTAMLLLAGHLQIAAYGMVAAGLAAVGMVATHRPFEVRAPALALLGMVLGGALAAPQLLPVAAYSRYSHRQNVPTEEGYQAYSASAIRPFELANLSSYRALGDPRTFSEVAPVAQYWVPLAKQGANLAESAVTIGPLAILLLLMAPVLKLPKRAWATVGLVGALALAMATGTPVNRLFYFLVPGWSASGSPGRAAVLFVLAAAVLAGVAIDRWREAEPARRAQWLGFAACAALALGLWRLGVSSVPPLSDDAETMARFNAGWTIPGAASIAVGLAGASLVLLRRSKWCRWLWAAAAAVAWGASAGPLRPMTAPGPLPPVASPGKSVRVAIVNDSWSLGAAAPALMPPNMAAASRIREVGGYDSLIHRDTVAMMREVASADAAPEANGNIMFVKPSLEPLVLAEMGVSEVWTRTPDPRLDATIGTPSQRAGFTAYAVSSSGRASVEGVPATFVADEPGRIVVRAQGPGDLVVRERAMPGWTAKVRGPSSSATRVQAVPDDRWMVVRGLGLGMSEVELRYEAPGLRLGFIVAGVGLGLGLAALLVLRRG